MSQGDTPLDDPTIANDARLIRAVSRARWIVDDGEGGKRPASGAFQDLTDAHGTRGMSVYIEEVLHELGLDHHAVLEVFDEHALVVLTAGLVRDCGLGVVHAPIDGPIGPAHAHATGRKTPGMQNRLARESERLIWP